MKPVGSRKTMTTNVEIFQRVIEAFNRDGVDGVLPYYTEDAEVYDPDLPPGTYRGREAVGRVIEMLISGFDDVEIRDFRLLPAGDRVVGLIHTRSMGERGDLEVETRDAHTDHVPRRQDQLLADLPGSGRSPPGRRPRPRAGEQRHAVTLLVHSYASRVGSTSVSRRARVAARRSRADRGRVGRRALRCRSRPRRAVMATPAGRAGRRSSTRRLGAIRSAQEFAASRGDVSFAVIDARWACAATTPRGSSARRASARRCCWRPSCGGWTASACRSTARRRTLLEPMIIYSDNRAADAIYAEVGDEGLEEVARAGRDAELRAHPGLLGRRPDHGRRHGPFLLPARPEPSRPASRLRQGPARPDRARRALGDPRGGRATAGPSGSRAAGARPGRRTPAARSPTRRRSSCTGAVSGSALRCSPTSPPAMRAASRRSRASPSDCWRTLRPAAGGGRPSSRPDGEAVRRCGGESVSGWTPGRRR